jgi:hypothetical protein
LRCRPIRGWTLGSRLRARPRGRSARHRASRSMIATHSPCLEGSSSRAISRVFDPSGEQPRERLDVTVARDERWCHGAVVVGHVFVIREFGSGERQRPQRGRKRYESSAMVSVSKGMHAEDARIESGYDPCLLSDPDAPLIELSRAAVERGAHLREITYQGVRCSALDLAHPATIRHHPEERALSTEAPAIVWEVAGEDRPMPPTNALSIQFQPTPPERSLGVHKNTPQFVAESIPGVLRREAVGLVEARVLVVAVTRVPRFVHRPRMPSNADPWRIRHATGLCRSSRTGKKNGAYRDRTGDLLLAKQALSQLS